MSAESQLDMPGRLPWQLHTAVWGSFAMSCLVLLGLFLAFRDVNVWEGWRESGELRNPAYCETVHLESIFRTRANTWSNLAYVLAGLYVCALAFHDRRRAMAQDAGYLLRHPVFSALFGLACVYLGLGSGLFHASLTRWGQQLDVAAMYAPLCVLIALNLGRWLSPAIDRPWLPGALAAAAAIVSALLYFYKWSMSSDTVLPALILGVAAFSLLDQIRFRKQVRARWFALSLGLLIVAVYCRQADIAGRFSRPDAWYQGHAVWHVLTSLTLACSYAYYRTERRGPALVKAG
ncbi:MAG: ceramidase domain-containing protein [Candidatus Hydrogenedentes bacterium]|nr:ceramidase domain-containing protein [Candidatus Hydrogenedentota bacterium]